MQHLGTRNNTACQLCLFWLVHIVPYMQVATELVVGFPKSFINKQMLARQKQLWGDWLDGFLALPINLPGFGMQLCIMHISMPDADKHVKHADPYVPVMH